MMQSYQAGSRDLLLLENADFAGQNSPSVKLGRLVQIATSKSFVFPHLTYGLWTILSTAERDANNDKDLPPSTIRKKLQKQDSGSVEIGGIRYVVERLEDQELSVRSVPSHPKRPT
eukprot:89968-Amphidinium_carterae.1